MKCGNKWEYGEIIFDILAQHFIKTECYLQSKDYNNETFAYNVLCNISVKMAYSIKITNLPLSGKNSNFMVRRSFKTNTAVIWINKDIYRIFSYKFCVILTVFIITL